MWCCCRRVRSGKGNDRKGTRGLKDEKQARKQGSKEARKYGFVLVLKTERDLKRKYERIGSGERGREKDKRDERKQVSAEQEGWKRRHNEKKASWLTCAHNGFFYSQEGWDERRGKCALSNRMSIGCEGNDDRLTDPIEL